MTQITFTIPGPAVGKERHETAVARDKFGNVIRSAKTGRMVVRHYTPAKTRAYEALVALLGKQAMAGRQPIQGAVAIGIDVALPIPKSWPKADKAAALAGTKPPTCKPDLSNVIKAVEDGLNGIAWHDDSQVTEYLPSRKRYGAEPGVTVTITSVEQKEES